MKKILFAVGGFLFAACLGIGSLQAQNSQTPRAYGDKDGDGICDITGLPIGQSRNQDRDQDRDQAGPAFNPNCPRNGQGAGQGTGAQTRSGAGQNRGSMGRGAGRG
jgi:hypothetical protein